MKRSLICSIWNCLWLICPSVCRKLGTRSYIDRIPHSGICILVCISIPEPGSWCSCCIMYNFFIEDLQFCPSVFTAPLILFVTLVCICMCILLSLPTYEFPWCSSSAVVVNWDLLRVRLCIWIYTAVYFLLSYVQFAQCLKYWIMCTVLCIVHIQIIYKFVYYNFYVIVKKLWSETRIFTITDICKQFNYVILNLLLSIPLFSQTYFWRFNITKYITYYSYDKRRTSWIDWVDRRLMSERQDELHWNILS
jgi:hypothetical protein